MLKMATNVSLRSRFEGCLVGAVAGDCLGAPYEDKGVPKDPLKALSIFFQKIGTTITEKDYLQYTDDTAMARCVAASLIDNKGRLNVRDLGKKFSTEYLAVPNRGYGGSVIAILDKLGEDQDNIFAPAQSQFGGSGSYGNGGAMRVAPVGLCRDSNFEKMIEAARDSARLTHTNALGYNGSILQCCAINLALHAGPSTLDVDSFTDRLLFVMERLELPAGGRGDRDAAPPSPKTAKRESAASDDEQAVYCNKLRLLKILLQQDASAKRIATELGNSIQAHNSVPAAIYSFLRCLKPVEGIASLNGLERTILYAISLDGDTDTIASMAGAIAGAYYGVEAVPKAWMTVCEGTQDAVQLADRLYDIVIGQE